MRLRTFGGLWIEGLESPRALGPRRFGLLALVAAAGAKGISREQVVGVLWPESPEDQARHSLSQCLYTLRREAGGEWIVAGTGLRLAPGVSSDVGEFSAALAAGELARAAELYSGRFLEGFYLAGAPEFERWAEDERGRIHAAAVGALERLASGPGARHEPGAALGWWRRLVEFDPGSARYAVGYMRALAAAGDQGGALAHARTHTAYVQRELESEVDPTVERLATELRAAPPPAAVRDTRPAVEPAAVATGAAEPAGIGSVGAGAAPAASGRKASRWAAAAMVVVVAAVALVASFRSRPSPASQQPMLAVGGIRADDSAALGPVLRDMLATGLGGVDGMQVVANSRLVELIPRGADTNPSATTQAARRAGASQVLEGEVGTDGAGLVLTLRRVEVATGVVRGGYKVHGVTRYALVDSAVAIIAADLGLASPGEGSAASRTASPSAYALYEEGLRAYYKYDAPAAQRLMSAALERDSLFAMAAFYAWKAGIGVVPLDESARALQVAKRLAPRAIEHDRLLIQGTVAGQDAPIATAQAIAETLTVRYPSDPDGQILLGDVRFSLGDWKGSVEAYERAVALDSAAGALGGANCRVCIALNGVSGAYLWWDSTAAAERAARRQVRLRPTSHSGWSDLVEPLLRQGRRAEAESAAAETVRFGTGTGTGTWTGALNRDLLRAGRFEEADNALVAELRSQNAHVRGDAHWLMIVNLRYQGRMQEAIALAERAVVPGMPWKVEGTWGVERRNPAIIQLEIGNPREAARRFEEFVRVRQPETMTPALFARHVAWDLVLAGTAWMAAGDTAAVRRIADTLELVGRQSNFGRDLRLHFFLRGLLLQGEGRHAEAVDEFRRALHSLTDGYNRINLELARSLLALGRPREAVAVLQPALRGGVDGSSTYLTKAELHELLAEAWERAGVRDSAVVHWRAVASAWRRADPPFQARRARALAAVAAAGGLSAAVDGP